ncbi:unnamed protein product [Toxocara canis]|uniref:Expansin-like EG45 domain-containing protein n=1 Tax=Toxocara canis TaxID=6265 RepID=A0A183UJB1_TOXCA|nr:unnamed protein product [Toxocara canis]
MLLKVLVVHSTLFQAMSTLKRYTYSIVADCDVGYASNTNDDVTKTAKTPIIGGKCEIGTADVHIGGKQTQFFLKCEATQGSEKGTGIWVVKSRAASPPQSVAESPVRVAVVHSVNAEAQQQPRQSSRYPSNICVQDMGAREGGSCSVPMTCLQQNVDDTSTFLQCDQNSNRWIRRSCSDGLTFSFEQQACVASVKQNYHRYVAPCSSNCSLGNACINGTCVVLSLSHFMTYGQLVKISFDSLDLCMDGSAPRGLCSNDASCPPRFRCTAQSLCCPLDQCATICPSHKFCSPLTDCCRPLLTGGGSCVSTRQCRRGLVCSHGQCLEDVLPKFIVTNDTVTQCATGYAHTAALTRCTLQQQCPPQTVCYAGRCCPIGYQFNETDQTPKDTTTTNGTTDPAYSANQILLNEAESLTPINSFSSESYEKFKHKAPIQMHECIDEWSDVCSFDDPCQEGFTCIMGRCCRVSQLNHRPCMGGQMPLRSPRECIVHTDCPPDSTCDQNRCCRDINIIQQSNTNTSYSVRQSRLHSITDTQKTNVQMVTDLTEVRQQLSKAADLYTATTDTQFDTTYETTEQQPLAHNKELDAIEERLFENRLKHPESRVITGSIWRSDSHKKRICPNGMEGLSTPVMCSSHKQCPSGYTCKRKVCCKPLGCVAKCSRQRCDNSCTHQNLEMPSVQSASTQMTTTSTHIIKSTTRCLKDADCELTNMCPIRYTCLRDGQCCDLGVHCADGTTPSHECIDELCPSSFDMCVHIDKWISVCCTNISRDIYDEDRALSIMTDKKEMTLRIPEAVTLPHYTATTPPKSTMPLHNQHRCKFSIECPRSHYCDLRGLCWPMAKSSKQEKAMAHFSINTNKPVGSIGQFPTGGQGGLVCVFMQCSNSNPCAQGTCNNGYCCTPSNIASVAISPSNFGAINLAGLPTAQIVPVAQGSSPFCTPGCPRGYSGCCGTQHPSCCHRQMCPGGLPSTGRPCFNSCPNGQICIAGVCCPQISSPAFNPIICPGGGQPFGRCTNGYCSPGYVCVPTTSMCCPQISQIAPISQISLSSSCPSGGVAAGSCINGLCGTGFSCVTPINLCCPLGLGVAKPSSNPFVCPDGTQAAGACVNGRCGTGFSCTGGLCCNATSQNPRCLDGSQAVGACINGRCGAGYTCTTGNVCCPSTSVVTSVCPNGATPVGQCINNLCPTGYTCINNQCCPTTTTATCTDPSLSIGPCTAGNTCTDGGFACDVARNLCCPRIAPIGPCVGGSCPNGFTCYPPGTATTSRCYQQCAGTGTPVGPVVNNVCPVGSTLVFGECCRTTRLRAPPLTSHLSENHFDPLPSNFGFLASSRSTFITVCQDATYYFIWHIETCTGSECRYPLFTLQIPFKCRLRPSNTHSIGTCMDGSPVVSGCIDGLCGAGLECINNFCCSRTTNNALSFSSQSTRAIGAACDVPQQCVGFAEGLSTCDMGICRCQPIAYTEGIACVRKKLLSECISEFTLISQYTSAIITI